MRIDAKIDGQLLLIEVPSGSGIEKGGVAKSADPDAILQSIAATVRIVAAHIGEGLDIACHVPPVAMEVRFAIRVDDKSVCSIATTPGEGQFLVTLKYDA